MRGSSVQIVGFGLFIRSAFVTYEIEGPLIRFFQKRYTAQHRGLTRTRRSDHGHDLAFVHLQVYALQYFCFSKRFIQIFNC